MRDFFFPPLYSPIPNPAVKGLWEQCFPVPRATTLQQRKPSIHLFIHQYVPTDISLHAKKAISHFLGGKCVHGASLIPAAIGAWEHRHSWTQ